jgi:hypothetical protein
MVKDNLVMGLLLKGLSQRKSDQQLIGHLFPWVANMSWLSGRMAQYGLGDKTQMVNLEMEILTIDLHLPKSAQPPTGSRFRLEFYIL